MAMGKPVRRAYLGILMLAWATLLGAAAPPATAPADEAAAVFEQLFGDDMRAAAATPEPKDDVQLAQKLLDAAKATPDAPALQAVLYERAAELAGRDPGAAELVVAALEAQARVQPERRAGLAARLLIVLERQYDAARGEARKAAGLRYLPALLDAGELAAGTGKGEEAATLYRRALIVAAAVAPEQREAVQARLRGLTEQEKLRERLKALEARVARGKSAAAGDAAALRDLQAAARELVEFHLLDTGDLAAARAAAGHTGDARLQTVAELAATPADALGADDALLLGDWYRAAAGRASEANKRQALERARTCYGRFLAAYEKKDATRLRIHLAAQALDKELSALPAAAGAGAVPAKPTATARPSDPPLPRELVPGLIARVYAGQPFGRPTHLITILRSNKEWGPWRKLAQQEMLVKAPLYGDGSPEFVAEGCIYVARETDVEFRNGNCNIEINGKKLAPNDKFALKVPRGLHAVKLWRHDYGAGGPAFDIVDAATGESVLYHTKAAWQAELGKVVTVGGGPGKGPGVRIQTKALEAPK